MLKRGDGIKQDGSYWYVLEVTPEENQGFRWLKVLTAWCGYGPMPTWHKESRTFLLDRTCKAPDGIWWR